MADGRLVEVGQSRRAGRPANEMVALQGGASPRLCAGVEAQTPQLSAANVVGGAPGRVAADDSD